MSFEDKLKQAFSSLQVMQHNFEVLLGNMMMQPCPMCKI
jgi:hypothetical protein